MNSGLGKKFAGCAGSFVPGPEAKWGSNAKVWANPEVQRQSYIFSVQVISGRLQLSHRRLSADKSSARFFRKKKAPHHAFEHDAGHKT
ncbi:MAG: hypothetical protein V4710_12095, partial [Verrucomicrobiota bacterium]